MSGGPEAWGWAATRDLGQHKAISDEKGEKGGRQKDKGEGGKEGGGRRILYHDYGNLPPITDPWEGYENREKRVRNQTLAMEQRVAELN